MRVTARLTSGSAVGYSSTQLPMAISPARACTQPPAAVVEAQQCTQPVGGVQQRDDRRGRRGRRAAVEQCGQQRRTGLVRLGPVGQQPKAAAWVKPLDCNGIRRIWPLLLANAPGARSSVFLRQLRRRPVPAAAAAAASNAQARAPATGSTGPRTAVQRDEPPRFDRRRRRSAGRIRHAYARSSSTAAPSYPLPALAVETGLCRRIVEQRAEAGPRRSGPRRANCSARRGAERPQEWYGSALSSVTVTVLPLGIG